MSVKLSKTEELILANLPEAIRAQVRAEILSGKEKARAKYFEENKEVIERANQRRNVFGTKITEKGMLSVYGMGYRYPVTIPRKGWETIFANLSTIQAEVAKLPKGE